MKCMPSLSFCMRACHLQFSQATPAPLSLQHTTNSASSFSVICDVVLSYGCRSFPIYDPIV